MANQQLTIRDLLGRWRPQCSEGGSSEVEENGRFFRRFTALFLAIALLGSGCGPGGSSGGEGGNFPREKLTLTIWRVTNDAAGFEEAVSTYQHEHDNVSFSFKVVKSENYLVNLLEALASGKGPDIMSLPNDQIHAFADKLAPMPDTLASGGSFFGSNPLTGLSAEYPKAVVTDALHTGKVYGIPLAINTLALFWNQSIFQKVFEEKIRNEEPFDQNLLLDAPADWTQLIAVTKLLTRRDGDTFRRSAVALGTSNNVPYTSDILAALLLQHGAALTTSDQKTAAFHLPDSTNPTVYPGVAALEYLRGFADPASSYYTWNAQQSDAVQAFIDGKVAMMFNYASVIPYLNQRQPGLNFQTAPFPQIANARRIVDFAGKYQIEVVNKDSRYPAVAWDFLRHMKNIGLSDYISDTGLVAANDKSEITTTVAARVGRLDPFRLQVATAQSWYKGGDPAAADRVLSQALDQVSQAGRDPKAVLFEAAAAFTTLLTKPSGG